MTDPQEPVVDLDDVPRDQLGDIDPMYPIVANALFGWLTHWATSPVRDHSLGWFLAALAAEGYRVTAVEVPDIHRRSDHGPDQADLRRDVAAAPRLDHWRPPRRPPPARDHVLAYEGRESGSRTPVHRIGEVPRCAPIWPKRPAFRRNDSR